ncbi:MAG: glycosyltransferase family 4 protein [Candidatus Dormibacteraeota bacterium]|nr:glycosyltransferase family 4 protein [Candidatus Dormibacteraeota bacterium]
MTQTSLSGPRVLIDARPLQGPSGARGIGSYVRGLLAGLLEQGFDHNVSLLVDGRLPTPSVPEGAFVAHSVRPRYRGRFGLMEEAATMGGRLERIRPRLYHATSLALPSRSPVPLVVTLHDLIPWALGGRQMWGERSRWWLGRRLLRRADLVIAVSSHVARDAQRLARIPEERLVVVPEGVGPGFRPAPGAAARVAERHGVRAPYLLYVGALDARKDPHGLLRAWQVARTAGADVELVVAGSPGPQAPAELPGARRLGHVSHSELVDLYSAAACFVFPSRNEGFGLPLLEAMACGCPVVAYRNSSIPEVVGEAGPLVEDGDAEALGAAAAQLACDSGRAEVARAAGLRRARRFTWARTASETIAAYRRLGLSFPARAL